MIGVCKQLFPFPYYRLFLGNEVVLRDKSFLEQEEVDDDWAAALDESEHEEQEDTSGNNGVANERTRTTTTASSTGRPTVTSTISKREARRLESLSQAQLKETAELEARLQAISLAPAAEIQAQRGAAAAQAERQVRRADLENTISLFGVQADEATKDAIVESFVIKKNMTEGSGSSGSGIKTINCLETQKDVDVAVKLVLTQLGPVQGSKMYPVLLESLFRDLVASRQVPEIRKLAGILSDMAKKMSDTTTGGGKKKPTIELGPKKKGGIDMTDYDDDLGGEY
jgi:hypothetical protein